MAPAIVFGTSHARMMIRNVRHFTSAQLFYLCCHSGWVDVPNCSWNCQLAVGDNGPIPCSLAIIVGPLLGNDVAGRCAGGPPNSICFFSSDERRVAPIIGIPAVQTKCPLCAKSGHSRGRRIRLGLTLHSNQFRGGSALADIARTHRSRTRNNRLSWAAVWRRSRCTRRNIGKRRSASSPFSRCHI